MKIMVLLAICSCVLGCTSNRPISKAGEPATSPQFSNATLSLQNSTSPTAQAAIERLHVGMSESEVFEIMRPVSLVWSIQPVFTEAGSEKASFGVSPTQELLLYFSFGKLVSIGPFVPARAPVLVFPASITSGK